MLKNAKLSYMSRKKILKCSVPKLEILVVMLLWVRAGSVLEILAIYPKHLPRYQILTPLIYLRFHGRFSSVIFFVQHFFRLHFFVCGPHETNQGLLG